MIHGERPGSGGKRSFEGTVELLEERIELMGSEGVSDALAHGSMAVAMAKAAEGARFESALAWAMRAMQAAALALGIDSVQYLTYGEFAQHFSLAHKQQQEQEQQRCNRGEVEEASPFIDAQWPLQMNASEGDPARGRYVLATRDLAAGDCVFIEEAPLAQTVHDNFCALVCHCCFAPLADEGAVTHDDTVHGCSTCHGVRYCSFACASTMAETHLGECEFVSQLGSAGVRADTATLRLYLRLLMRVVADPSALEKVEKMRDHYDDCGEERQEKLLAQADGLLGIMLPASTCTRGGLDSIRVARLIDRVHVSAFAIGDPAGVAYGTGLYVEAGSLFNHSCSPSACVSFVGRRLRIHMLRDLKKGDEISIAYTELYAGREERQAALRANKGFTCRCIRCESPPTVDAQLESWRCQASGCNVGCVPPGELKCAACGAAHALPPAARAAIEAKWKTTLDGWSTELLGGAAVEAPAGTLRERSRSLHMQIERFLRRETSDRLCETHLLRHRAFVLRSYVFAAAGAPPDCLADAIEQCTLNMERHLKPTQPNYVFFLHRLALALGREVEESQLDYFEAAQIRKRADKVGARALRGLEIAYGPDHPLVDRWRAEQVGR